MGTNLTKHIFTVSRENRESISGHKGKFLIGEIKGFTGTDAPYEDPQNAEIEIKNMTNGESVNFIFDKLKI